MKNLMKALLNAQKSMGAANKGASNPYFKSKYADYGAVLEAVKEPLNENGIVLLQPHVVVDGRNYVKTVLIHAESGEEYSSMTEVVCAKQNDPQAFGSAITYARRYGLQSLPCLPTEDDDGEGAMVRNKAPAKAAEAPKTTTPVAVQKAQAVTETPKAEQAKVATPAPAAKPETKPKSSFRTSAKTTTVTTPVAAPVANGKTDPMSW